MKRLILSLLLLATSPALIASDATDEAFRQSVQSIEEPLEIKVHVSFDEGSEPTPGVSSFINKTLRDLHNVKVVAEEAEDTDITLIVRAVRFSDKLYCCWTAPATPARRQIYVTACLNLASALPNTAAGVIPAAINQSVPKKVYLFEDGEWWNEGNSAENALRQSIAHFDEKVLEPIRQSDQKQKDDLHKHLEARKQKQ